MWKPFAAVLLLAIAVPAGAARYVITCKPTDTGEAYIKRIPRGSYDRSYPACMGASAVGDCVFAFCPDIGTVVGCYLNPSCEQKVSPCSRAMAGTLFNVRRGHKLHVGKVGKHRVVLRCKR